MQAIRIFFFLLLLFLKTNYLCAQKIPITFYNSNNGLPIDDIYAATQDEDGFMWFASNFGITRFDGYKFTNYDKKNGIKGTAVIDIVYAGKDSLIFVAYPLSIQSINKNGNVHTLVENTQIPFHQITRHGNSFYFVHRNNTGFAIWEQNKYTFSKADSIFGIEGLKINSIFSLGKQGVGFCTNKGLFVQNNGGIKIILKNKDVQIGVKQKNEKVVLVCNNRIIFLQENGAIEETPWQLPPGFNPYHIVEENSAIWIRNIRAGVYRLKDGKFLECSKMLDLTNKTINELFSDRDGNLWVCTDGKGILFSKKIITKNFTIDDGLPDDEVLNLYQQDNRLFIGTANGIGVLKDDRIEKLNLPVSKEGLQYTHHIFKANGGRTGLNIGRTFTFNKSKESNYTLDYGKEFLAVNAMFAWQENEEDLWLFEGPASIRLVKLHNRKNASWIDVGTYKIKRIYKMLKWENEYWIGTDKGYLRILNNAISLTETIGQEQTGQVFDFYIDRKNRLWMATEKGLYYFERGNMYTVPKSLSSTGNYCKSITEDDKGTIWCATWNGIFSYDGKQKEIFRPSRGISANKNNAILFDSIKKQLYIGSINGLDILPLSREESIALKNPVFIDANLNDSSNKKLYSGIILNPDENDLKFYLSIPFYNREEIITYVYKLDNGVWNSTSNPEINFKNLKPGKHTIYARARSNDIWISDKVSELSFKIKTPFYKTWWFITGLVILSQLLLLWIINHFNRKAKEKKINLMQRDAEFAALKQKAFTALLNPHFIFNALNSIQFYINKNDRQNANKYLSDFASLIRKNFDAAQDAFINLEDELDNLRLYLQLEQMRFTNKFSYTIEMDKDFPTEDWMIPSMVLQPLLENAILHGLMPLEQSGNLFIKIKEIDKKLEIIIEDDGIGITKSKSLKAGSKHKSKGMQLIKERLQILSKITKEPLLFTIENSSETLENKGTKITLSIPPDLFTEFEKHSAAVNELKD